MTDTKRVVKQIQTDQGPRFVITAGGKQCGGKFKTHQAAQARADRENAYMKTMPKEESFMLAESVIALCDEDQARKADLEKARAQADKARSELARVQQLIKREKDSGKSDSVMDSLHKKYKELQSKVSAAWKAYDQKYGTNHHQAYA